MARANGKCVATACAPQEYDFWLGLGIDLLFCTNDIACLKHAASELLSDAREVLARRVEAEKQAKADSDGARVGTER
jgi:hypothetical protein